MLQRLHHHKSAPAAEICLFVSSWLRLYNTAVQVIHEPGNSEYLEEFPLGFYWSSIRARVHKLGQFALLEIGELGAGGPIYL